MFRLISMGLVFIGLGILIYGGVRLAAPAPSGETPGVQPSEIRATPPPTTPTPGAGVPSLTGPSLDADDMRVRPAGAGGGMPDWVSGLQTVPIAHETPTRARFGRAFDVSVAIDATGSESAAEALPGLGQIVEGEARISANVQAALSGEAFEIEAVTPLIQRISPLTPNVWRWRVTPLEAGAHELRIELFALNEDQALPVRTFRDRVEVRVSRIGQAISFANTVSPVAMVLGGLGSLLAGLFGVARFFRGR
ncbi:MAG: hypothetical protein AAGF20_13570 [Pseudomonadota bacterium]